MTSPLAPPCGARSHTPSECRTPLAPTAAPAPPISNTTRHALAAIADRGEQVRGVWEMGEGLVFVDCECAPAARHRDIRAAPLEPPGVHHFRIRVDPMAQAPGQAGDAIAAHVTLTNAFLRAGEAAADRSLQVTMSSGYLAGRAMRLGLDPESVASTRTVRSDLGIGCLVGAHQAGVDHGLSGQQPYFDSLRLGIEARLITLYMQPQEGADAESEVMTPARGRRAIDYVESHIGGDLRLDMLAAAASMSKFHFSRAFRNTFGLSPHAFVMHRRLARALDLLRGPLPVGEVAARCGFSDNAHLTRQFKRAFCVPPSAIGRNGAAA